MANLNTCHFIGTLTRDPELRVTPKGTAVCSFSLAINRKWKDEGGGEREEVSFLEFEAWAKAGETISKYCEKGKQLYVQARAKQETWEDKDTQKKRSKIKFIVDGFQFIGGKQDGDKGRSEKEPDRSPDRSPAPPRQAAPPQENLDEDVPF